MQPGQYFLEDDGIFPNNILPALVYKQALHLPPLIGGFSARMLLYRNGWRNNWRSGIYTYHHYHSTTHEAMAVIAGETLLQLGGDNGATVHIRQGDVVVIPAGVAYKNLGAERDVVCIGGYPGGADYDMNYGKPGERPRTDAHIAAVPVPSLDPVRGGKDGPLPGIWNKVHTAS